MPVPNLSESVFTPATAVPAALVAFLRGVERRAALLAQLQCGDPQVADAALAATMRAFRNTAAQAPVSDWQRRFWSLLLAAPGLRHRAPDGHWPESLAALASLGTGTRAALLLRLVAGLEDADAAAALAVATDTYHRALARAVPRNPDGTVDAPAWQQLAEACQQALRQLPPERLAHLARLREQALLPAPGRRASRRVRERPRWWSQSLWGALVACLLALAASFLLPSLLVLRGGEPRITREPLPPAAEPAARYDQQSALLTDPDFELATAGAAPADVGFLSWYAAQLATPMAGIHASSADATDTTVTDDTAAEGIDAPP